MTPDPRPLLGEPLPLDLVNTRWRDGDAEHDLLRDWPDGLAVWLAGAGLDDVEATPATLDAVLAVREALVQLTGGGGPGGVEGLNDVLRHGWVRRTLGPDGAHDVVEVDEPHWLPAWRAADGYLRLLDTAPSRIRTCAGDCTLRFHDTSKAGRRRWCSMAVCGNRAKAREHQARRRA